RAYAVPRWLHETTHLGGTPIPNDTWIEIGVALLVLAAFKIFLRYTRYGLIIRAGVENRAMVTALGIDVRRAFTLVFAFGGIAAVVVGLSQQYVNYYSVGVGDLSVVLLLALVLLLRPATLAGRTA